MPKMKSHRGAAKRFKTTGSGKIRRRRSHNTHLKLTKTSRRKRRLQGEADVSPADRKAVRKLLGR